VAIITLFEMATQNGEIVGYMGRYLKRQLHTYDIVRENSSPDARRLYRVFFDHDHETPIMVYPIPERLTTQTTSMWAHQVRDELDAAWALA